MSTATHGKLVRRIGSGDWTITATTAAQLLTGLVALVGFAAWLTLAPVLILTFLFLEPLLLVSMVVFVVAALSSRRSLLVEHFRAGEVVFRQGNAADFLYLVRAGEFEGMDSEGTMHQKVGPGEFFGTAALVAGQRRRLTVRATSEAVAVRVDPQGLTLLAQSDPRSQAAVRELLEARVEDLATGSTAPAQAAH